MSIPAIGYVFLFLLGPPTPAPTEIAPATSQARSSAAKDSFEVRISAMERRIDALEVALGKYERSWYRDPAILIAFLALIFSFGTTAVSYYRAAKQDLHEARAELRSLIQRLSGLQREFTELPQKYPQDATTRGTFSALLNEENALIAKQAAEVIERIPKHVSATEYLAVANALAASGIFDKVKQLLEKAIAVANDVNDETNALRVYGNYLFTAGDPGRGRIQYQTALNIFSKYPTANAYYVTSTHVVTEKAWAVSEAAIGARLEAKNHLEKARAYA